MIYHLDAGIDVQLWSPDDIREETHRDDRDLITDEHIGIRFYLTVTDAVLLIGTEQQVIDRMQQVIALVRRERAILDGPGPGLPDGRYGIGVVGDVHDLTGTAEDLAEFGQALATRWQSPLVMALSDLGDVLNTDRGLTQFPQSLTCGEVDALARVLALSGSFNAAVGLVGTHAEADDGEETHAHIRELARLDEECTHRGQKVDYSLADAASAEHVQLLISD
jgi:hypothetical protein